MMVGRGAVPGPVLVALAVLLAGAAAPVAGGPVLAGPAPGGPTADVVGSPGGDAAGPATQSASISPTVTRVDRGDVATVTVSASSAATVYLGSSEVGFVLRANVSSGTTKLRLNTYATDPDEFVRTDVRNVTLLTDPLPEPLATGTYPVNVTVGGVERAVGALTVESRATGGSAVFTAPDGVDLEAQDTPAQIRQHAVPLDGDPVARGDWLIYRFESSGIAGFVDRATLSTTDSTEARQAAAAAVTFSSNRSGNVGPTAFTAADADEFVANRSGDTYYVVVNTADHGIAAGDRFTAEFRLGASNPVVDEEETTAATFAVTGRSVSVDYDGQEIVATNRTTVRGTTTLSPGSTFEVTARNVGQHPYLETKTVTVAANRTFSAAFDFASIPAGTEFQLRIPAFDRKIPMRKATPEPETTTTTATTTTTTTTATPTPTSVDTTTTTTTTATPTATTTTTPNRTTVSTAAPVTLQAIESGGQPGFGALPAVAALVAAALLAARAGREED